MLIERKYSIGAEFLPDWHKFHFRVWAPERTSVRVHLCYKGKAESNHQLPIVTLAEDDDGYFEGFLPFFPEDLLYGFILDNEPTPLPDPASRFQPFGIHGLSEFINPSQFPWSDSEWKGISEDKRILYEMHIGTFTPEGTWQAAARELKELAKFGITIIELMPVAEFYGTFNWGYDGIFQFAPTNNYGHPDDFRFFVDTAHRYGIGIVLDVVYNHFGRKAAFFKKYSRYYFTDRYTNEWGEAINFDDHHSQPVREYFLCNSAYWIEEFHVDGLRIDATQQIFDNTKNHILSEIVTTARAAGGKRNVHIIAENEPQDSSIIRDFKIDAVWSDDFHRSAMVALTGRAEAYFSDYQGNPQEFISAAKYGYLYQGQYYRWQKKKRGSPSFDISSCCFIHYLQNHDQIANSCRGLRLHFLTSAPLYRALTALLLLGPQTPMLFQGQEFCSSSPFYYFADNIPPLSERNMNGRKKFLSQFPSIASVDGPLVPPPASSQSFAMSKLDLRERNKNYNWYIFHSDLLTLRKNTSVLFSAERRGIDGSVIGEHAIVLRYFGSKAHNDRLLIINMGNDITRSPDPEPLMAPPLDCEWKVFWHSERAEYGGSGCQPLCSNPIWKITGKTALFLIPVNCSDLS